MARAKKSPVPEDADLESKILAAARRSFSELGYSATSLRTIASEVGATAPMINYYFGSKADLFERIVDRALVSLRESVAPILTGTSSLSVRLIELGRAYLDFAARSPDELRLYYRLSIAPADAPPGKSVDALRNEGFRDVRRLVEDGFARGEFALRDGYGTDDVVAHVVATMEYVFLRAVVDDGARTAHGLARAQAELERMLGVVLLGLGMTGGAR